MLMNVLVGYVRKSDYSIKVSINVSAFEDCTFYETADGQKYVPLVINLNSLRKVIEGERAVTTLSQIVEEEE